MNEILTSGLAIIATLAGLIRWLIQVYFKQSKELAKTKNDLYQLKVESLNDVLKDHKQSLSNMHLELHSLIMELKRTREEMFDLRNNLREMELVQSKTFDNIKLSIEALNRDVRILKSNRIGIL